MPVPGSRAGRNHFEGLSKAMPSCPLPGRCLEHTLLFVPFNASSRSVQPEAPLAAKRSCTLVSLGGDQDFDALNCITSAPIPAPHGLFIFPVSWGRWVSCLLMEERLGLR